MTDYTGLTTLVPGLSPGAAGFWGLSERAWIQVLREGDHGSMTRLVETYPEYGEEHQAIWHLLWRAEDPVRPTPETISHLYRLLPPSISTWARGLVWATVAGPDRLRHWLALIGDRPQPWHYDCAEVAYLRAGEECETILLEWCPLLAERHYLPEQPLSLEAEIYQILQEDNLDAWLALVEVHTPEFLQETVREWMDHHSQGHLTDRDLPPTVEILEWCRIAGWLGEIRLADVFDDKIPPPACEAWLALYQADYHNYTGWVAMVDRYPVSVLQDRLKDWDNDRPDLLDHLSSLNDPSEEKIELLERWWSWDAETAQTALADEGWQLKTVHRLWLRLAVVAEELENYHLEDLLWDHQSIIQLAASGVEISEVALDALWLYVLRSPEITVEALEYLDEVYPLERHYPVLSEALGEAEELEVVLQWCQKRGLALVGLQVETESPETAAVLQCRGVHVGGGWKIQDYYQRGEYANLIRYRGDRRYARVENPWLQLEELCQSEYTGVPARSYDCRDSHPDPCWPLEFKLRHPIIRLDNINCHQIWESGYLSVTGTEALLERHPDPLHLLGYARARQLGLVPGVIQLWDRWLRERGGGMISGPRGEVYLWGVDRVPGWWWVSEAQRLQCTGPGDLPTARCLLHAGARKAAR